VGLLPSWNRQTPAPRPPPPPRRESSRIKAMAHSFPINPQTNVWIDLTGRNNDEDTRVGKVFGLNPATPFVVQYSVAAKGKMMVHIVEKGIQIMEQKMKKKKPS
jgi:hypothetical protein